MDEGVMDELKAHCGLTLDEVRKRQAAEGCNEFEGSAKRSVAKIILEIMHEPMFVLLLGAGSIYLLMGDIHEALILLGFVWVIIGITVLQEWRTERVLEALRDLSSPRAEVIRGGNRIRISGSEVVRGDIAVVVEGDRIPADGILLFAHELAADESMLSGESLNIVKSSGDRIFAGTLIVSGQGIMEVDSIGSHTELGKIGKSLQSIDTETSPLQIEIALLTKRLAIIAVVLCLAVAGSYIVLRGGWLDGILAGITLAMGILPQEFPVILIVFMALGARRIARHQVLTRRLNAIETLGETTVLCVDKTGTLTQNKMEVAALAAEGKIYSVDEYDEFPEELHELIEYAILASETDPHDPMEKAFYRLAQKHSLHIEHYHPDWNLAREYELSPEMMAMSHLWNAPKQFENPVATKGAPEAIIDLCHLEKEAQESVMNMSALMADRGLRVIGVAKAVYEGEKWPTIQHDFDFEFLGLVGLADPLRDEVPLAVQECHNAGIRVVMITGDYPRTAKAIAKQAGIEGGIVISGSDIDAMAPDVFDATIKTADVFARVTPLQKLHIVEAMKKNGEVVAMTGDGVNDAPALKSAHIGIAMGKRGTDVAREAASLVLLEDNFGAIVETIKLGRRIFANLRKAMMYTISVHIPIIALSTVPLAIGLPLVLAPIHIVFLELIIDPACSIVFEAEPAEEGCMNISPRAPEERLMPMSEIALSLVQGIVASVGVIFVYWAALKIGVAVQEARAMSFVVLVTANTILILSSLGRKKRAGMLLPIGKVGSIVIAVTLFSLFLVCTISSIASLFLFAPLGLMQFAIASGIGFSLFFAFEMTKILFALVLKR